MMRNETRSRERLTDLFNEEETPDRGPYLARPPQQFRTLDSRYNQLVYDVTPAAERALLRADSMAAPATARSGPWLHSFMVSCITASIELAGLARSDLRFIPQSQILARAGTDLRFPVPIVDPISGHISLKDLLPDALFGLEYLTGQGSRFRFFAVEADRATEPATSTNFNRKSVLRNLRQYEQYVGRHAYREHLRLTAPLLVLHVSCDASRTERMIDLISREHPDGNAYMLFQSWEDFGPVFRPPQPNSGLLSDGWTRAGCSPFRIDRI